MTYADLSFKIQSSHHRPRACMIVRGALATMRSGSMRTGYQQEENLMWRAIQASDRRSVSRAKRMPAAKAKRRRIARSMALPHGLPADERLLSLGRSGPGVRSGLLETPRTRFVGVFSRPRRPRPSSQFPDMRGSRPAPLKGCGRLSPAHRRATIESRRVRHGPGRALPSRWPGRGPLLRNRERRCRLGEV